MSSKKPMKSRFSKLSLNSWAFPVRAGSGNRTRRKAFLYRLNHSTFHILFQFYNFLAPAQIKKPQRISPLGF